MRSGEAQQASSSYVIQPLDFVVFRIIDEPETQVQVRVSSDGSIVLPYVRSVKIGGLTVEQARQFVFEMYDGDYYINPQIDLAILASKERMVQVMGYVVRPGNVAIPAERALFLMEAISAAGGAVPLGDLRRVEIRRTGEKGEQVMLEINTEGITSRDHELKDGDIISIPRRRI
jgi:polysaccharide biosynthesis/export protein